MKSTLVLIINFLFFSLIGTTAHAELDRAQHVEFPKNQLQAEFHWVKGPLIYEESHMKVIWKDASGSLVSKPVHFEVILWMPTMDHGSAPTVIKNDLFPDGSIQAGTYSISNVYFIMGGYWEVIVKLMNSNGKVEEQKFIINFDE